MPAETDYNPRGFENDRKEELLIAPLAGQPPGAAQGPTVTSPEIAADRRVTFRILWERTFGPLPAGAYRYVFTVNGLTVVDSRNPMTSQTNTTVYSLAVVPGSDLFDTKHVPHGAVASVL